MKIALCTDAWLPQINGVVTTWMKISRIMAERGDELEVIHPGIGRTMACPRYPQIRLALWPGAKVAAMLEKLRPEAIHIATEGPIGGAARRWCRKNRLPFTTSYHTQFPLYLKQYAGIPETLSYAFLRRFHQDAAATLVPTRSLTETLQKRGFERLVTWTRGVDYRQFTPPGNRAAIYPDLPRPVFLYCGRVAREKNLDAFLALDLPGSKVIIGDGPDRARLEKRFPGVHWTGFRQGPELARLVSGGDVFVFPSKTDTFGVVMLEAMACGLPVAAYPVTGPVDVVDPGVSGFLDHDLGRAALNCLKLNPRDCRRQAESFNWQRVADIFLETLVPIPGRRPLSETAPRRRQPALAAASAA